MKTIDDTHVFKADETPLRRGVYVLGNPELLNSSCISVAGTRKIDKKSKDWLNNILEKCNRTIVSGLALGTDTVAHQKALKLGLPTIAILPTGFKKITPRKNTKLARKIIESGGALVSEYAHLKGIDSFSQYHERNELIAKLGDMLIVPQFNKESGTRSTVNYARKNKKPIIVQDADYSGNKFIINNKDYFTLIK